MTLLNRPKDDTLHLSRTFKCWKLNGRSLFYGDFAMDTIGASEPQRIGLILVAFGKKHPSTDGLMQSRKCNYRPSGSSIYEKPLIEHHPVCIVAGIRTDVPGAGVG